MIPPFISAICYPDVTQIANGQMALTDKAVKNAKATDKRQELPDGDGLYLVVQPTGAKVWVHRYRYGGRPVKMAVGTYPATTLADARVAVRANRAVLDKHDDPRDAKRAKQADAKATVFSDYVESWLTSYAAGVTRRGTKRRVAGVNTARSMLTAHLVPKLGKKPLPKITDGDLKAALNSIPGASSRKAADAYARLLFRDALDSGDITANPMKDVAKVSAVAPRKRVMTDKELARVWASSGDMANPWASFFRLLILTGQRRNEVAGITWAELDRDAKLWTLPADRAKNGADHVVPLSPTAVGLLDTIAGGDDWPEAGFVLTTGRSHVKGFGKAKAALDVLTGSIPDWCIHDLRRALATGFQKLGVRFEVTEAVLNHISGAKGGVAGIYQLHDWKDEKRAALDAWTAHVEGLKA